MTVSIDYSNMMIGLDSAASDFQIAFTEVEKLRANGSIGFMDVPFNNELLEQSVEFAELTRGKYDDVVVLGIGGSALGPIALRSMLRPPFWNSLSSQERDDYPRLHVLDNIDPETVAFLFARLRLERTLFIVTSKSGGTAETMSQYFIAHDKIIKRGLSARDHFVFITDPQKGALRKLAKRDSVPVLDIPSNVGGRFSVLTAVGMLPAALMGIDVAQLLEGARNMVELCGSPEIDKNPAGTFAALQWLSHEKNKKNIHVLMPYSDSLRDIAAWFVQLWAESLGKIRDGVSVGPTPISALGATDQHSQVQLFMEGPADKTVTFIAVKEREADVEIPIVPSDMKDLVYLGGHSLGELLDAERRGTAAALAERGRPNMTIAIDRVDPWHVGALMMLFETATAYAGQLYGVDAFNQPGVELGKKFAYSYLNS